jgi:hypothetical protein
MGMRVKAASPIHALQLARETFGDDALDRMKAHLGPESCALLDRRLSPVEWLDVGAWQPVNEAILDHLCGGDEARFMAFLRTVCERDFNTLYRAFLKVLSPAFVLDRTAKVWRTYYDASSLHLVRLPPVGARQHLRFELRGYAPFPRARLVLQAFFEQILTMSGAKRITIDASPARLSIDGMDCEFAISFE